MIGPIFFDGTINSERHCEVVLYRFMGHSNEGQIARSYFQQDGVTSHTARVPMTPLRDVFRDRIISKDICPTLSPYATTPDCCVCGEIKGEIFKDNSYTLLKLKEAASNLIGTLLGLNCCVSL
jgi:hypothetical protein